MTFREAELAEVGVRLYPSDQHDVSFGLSDIGTYSVFSGYGEFTPITVRSDTVLLDADLERNKRRD